MKRPYLSLRIDAHPIAMLVIGAALVLAWLLGHLGLVAVEMALVALAASADALTTLGLLNFCVLQWFGVRLARHRANVSVRAEWLMPIGTRCLFITTNGKGPQPARVVAWVDGGETVQWHSLSRWIWPLTGWWTDYCYIARRP